MDSWTRADSSPQRLLIIVETSVIRRDRKHGLRDSPNLRPQNLGRKKKRDRFIHERIVSRSSFPCSLDRDRPTDSRKAAASAISLDPLSSFVVASCRLFVRPFLLQQFSPFPPIRSDPSTIATSLAPSLCRPQVDPARETFTPSIYRPMNRAPPPPL